MKKANKNSWINKVLVIYILIYIGIIALDIYTGGCNKYLKWLKMATSAIPYVLLMYVSIDLFKITRHYFRAWLKKWCAIPIVIGITLAIPFGTHLVFYRENKIEEAVLITSYTTYLTFVGAFCLGFFLYKRDEQRRQEVLRKKARLIYESMLKICTNLGNIDGCIKRSDTIITLPSWRTDYLDIKHLVEYEENALYSELDFFFNTVDTINKAIQRGEMKYAKTLYEDFEKREMYWPSAYNYLDALEVLLFISTDMKQCKPWTEGEKKQIKKYADQFFDVVNVWIYNYMLQRGGISCNASEIRYELVDWLLTNPELDAWVKSPYDKRKVSEIVFNISLQMSQRSEKVDFCWGEYSLKEDKQL